MMLLILRKEGDNSRTHKYEWDNEHHLSVPNKHNIPVVILESGRLLVE